MNPVVHFEMPYMDRDRAADFYSKVFGWKAHKLDEDMGSYVVVHTGETDEKNMLKRPGMINGGLFKRSEDHKNPSVVIAVDDIQKAMKDVEAGGGKVIGASKGKEPDMIPGIGLYIAIEDTEGNKVALLQPLPRS